MDICLIDCLHGQELGMQEVMQLHVGILQSQATGTVRDSWSNRIFILASRRFIPGKKNNRRI